MASAAECLAAIEKAAGGTLDDETISELLEDLARLQERRGAKDSLETLEQALFRRAGEIAEDADLAATIEKRNRLINIVKEAELLDLAERADAATNDPSLGLEAATVGVNAPFKGGRISVDAQAQGIRNTTMGGVISDLKKEGLLPVFNGRSLEREIGRELWDLSLKEPTGKATDSGQARAIAKILHKHRRALIEQENRAGAYIRFKQGYVVRQSHNRTLMNRAGEESWSNFMMTRVDWDAMDVPPEKRAGFLKSAYNALVTGVHKDFNGGRDNDLMFSFRDAEAPPARQDILETDGAWRDATVRAVDGNGAEIEIPAGRAVDGLKRRMDAARQLLDCVRASG